ncbi:MAG: hypothetical protein ACP5IO_04725 [Elusimicrobiales bacterium]
MKKGLRVRVNLFERLLNFFDDYDFIHFGSETCENLVFCYARYIKKLIKLKKKVILSIPPLSQKTFEYLTFLLRGIKKDLLPDYFIFSLNDFGTLSLIKKIFGKDFEISIGRHFTKYFFSLGKNIFEFNSIYSLDLINKCGVKYFEISSFDKFPNNNNLYVLKNRGIRFEFILHHPFSLLSTSRNCTVGFHDISQQDTPKGIECDNSCIYGDYKIYVKKFNIDLFLCENSVYKKMNDTLFIKPQLLSKIYVKAVVNDFLGGI